MMTNKFVLLQNEKLKNIFLLGMLVTSHYPIYIVDLFSIFLKVNKLQCSFFESKNIISPVVEEY